LCEVLTLLLDACTIRGNQNSCIAWSHCSTKKSVTTLVATCSTRKKWRLVQLLDHEARLQAISCLMMEYLPQSMRLTLILVREVHRIERLQGQYRVPQSDPLNISPSLAHEDNRFPCCALCSSQWALGSRAFERQKLREVHSSTSSELRAWHFVAS
jgi:hypothetical protein